MSRPSGHMTWMQRRLNVMTLHRRWGDVVLTSCARWGNTALSTRLHVHVIALRSMVSRASKLALDGRQRFCLSRVDVQADLSLRWSDMWYCRKRCIPAHMYTVSKTWILYVDNTWAHVRLRRRAEWPFGIKEYFYLTFKMNLILADWLILT